MKTLTQKELLERAPLLNLSAVCAAARVSYTRMQNIKRGRGHPLTPEELERIEKVLETLAPEPSQQASNQASFEK